MKKMESNMEKKIAQVEDLRTRMPVQMHDGDVSVYRKHLDDTRRMKRETQKEIADIERQVQTLMDKRSAALLRFKQYIGRERAALAAIRQLEDNDIEDAAQS